MHENPLGSASFCNCACAKVIAVYVSARDAIVGLKVKQNVLLFAWPQAVNVKMNLHQRGSASVM